MTVTVCVGNPYFFTAVNYVGGLWFLAELVRRALPSLGQFGAKYNKLDDDKRRNVVAYILQLTITTLALIAQLFAGPGVFSFDTENKLVEDINDSQLSLLFFSAQSIVFLYLWELIFRQNMGFPLLAHHLLTIFSTQMAMGAFYVTSQIVFLELVWLGNFHATTEQLSFVALLLYRLDMCQKYHSLLFLSSSILAFICKTGTVAVWFALYIVKIDIFRSEAGTWGRAYLYGLVPGMLLLYVAQVHSCFVQWHLSKKTRWTADKEITPGLPQTVDDHDPPPDEKHSDDQD